MSKNPVPDDKDILREGHSPDYLAQVYAEQVSPDIAEINEHAEALAADAEVEPEHL